MPFPNGQRKRRERKEKKLKRKRTRRRMLLFMLILGIGFLVAVRFLCDYHGLEKVQPLEVLQNGTLVAQPGALYSRYAVLVRRSDGSVLLDKNSREQMYPASMTKIMTVLVALRELPLDREVSLTSDIFEQMKRENASVAGFRPGASATVRDLLYGAILPSGGECCLGLARAAAGSEEEFVRQMNREAQALELEHTHFVNSTGLHDGGHYSTAWDIAQLLDAALDNPTFREIFTARRYYAAGNDIAVFSSLFDSGFDTELPNGTIMGGKTGHTNEAGYCLASLASIGGEEYILVTAHAPREGQNIEDAVHVYSSIDIK